MSDVDVSTESRKQLVTIGLILAVIGLLISAYSLSHHLELKANGSTQAFCNINETFSCDTVANSKYSEDPFGNPLGVYGIGFFAGLGVMLLIAQFKAEYRRDALHGYAALVVLGVISSIILGFISHFDVGALCLTCIGIYIVNAIQAAVLYFSRAAIPPGMTFKSVTNGGFYALATLLVAIGLFQMLKPMPNRSIHPDNPVSVEEAKKLLEQLQKQQADAPQPEATPIKIDRSPYSGFGEDYRKGPDNAKVTVVEFADFQCPACADAYKTMKRLRTDFGDRIQIVFKNYPLDSSCNPGMNRALHPHACTAAILSRCAGRYGDFWQLHDKIFDNQRRISAENLQNWAKQAGLSDGQIEECMNAADIKDKIKDDINQANALGLTGTPTIFINGAKVNARGYEDLRVRIEYLLNR